MKLTVIPVLLLMCNIVHFAVGSDIENHVNFQYK